MQVIQDCKGIMSQIQASLEMSKSRTGEGKYGAFPVSQTITTALIIAAWYSSNIGVLLLNKCLLSFLDADTQYSSQCCTCVPVHFMVFWQFHG